MALSCLFWYVLLSVSCDTPDGPDLPSPGDAVPLRFSASASLPGGTPGTRAVGELITGFPEDGTTSTFGMSLTKEDGHDSPFHGFQVCTDESPENGRCVEKQPAHSRRFGRADRQGDGPSRSPCPRAVVVPPGRLDAQGRRDR